MTVASDPTRFVVAGFAWTVSALLPRFTIRAVARTFLEWPAAMAVGLFGIYASFLVSTLLGIPFGLITLALWQAGFALAVGFLWRLFPAPAVRLAPWPHLPWWGWGSVVVFVAALVLGFLSRPAAGPDHAFRWEFLAEQMFRTRRLDYYPAVDSSKMQRYFYCDGFPPFVAAELAWLDFLANQTSPYAGLPVLLAAAAGTVYYLWQLGKLHGGEPVAVLAVAVFASGPGTLAALRGVCDSTVMVPAVAGMTYYLLRFRDEEEGRAMNIALAAVFAAIASQAREYGPAYGIAGLVWVLFHAGLRQWSLRFAALLIALGGAWYMRVLLITGNPFWSNAFLGLPVNRVHAGIMDAYRSQIESGLGFHAVAKMVFWAMVGTPLALVGVLESGANLRRYSLISLLSLVAGGLFLRALLATSGGYGFAFRVYAPAAVLLSIPAAAWWRRIRPRPWIRIVLTAALAAMLARSACDLALYPQSLCADIAMRIRHQPIPQADQRRADQERVEAVMKQMKPGGTLLTDDAGLASGLTGLGGRVLMIWDPSVRFLYEGPMTPDQTAKRLSCLGVTDLSFSPSSLGWKYIAQNSLLFELERPLVRSRGVIRLPLGSVHASADGSKN